ncbi:hypothetical protein [Azospirillum argentinense]
MVIFSEIPKYVSRKVTAIAIIMVAKSLSIPNLSIKETLTITEIHHFLKITEITE